MGFNTTVVVYNDSLSDIESDPEFGKRLVKAIQEQGGGREKTTVFAFGAHGSSTAAVVVDQHHADETSLVAVGGNMGGLAGYNTFAQVYNTVEAVRFLPGVFGDLGKLFNSKDKSGVLLMLLLVALAVVGGILTTATIVERTAEAQRERVRWQLEDAKDAMRHA